MCVVEFGTADGDKSPPPDPKVKYTSEATWIFPAFHQFQQLSAELWARWQVCVNTVQVDRMQIKRHLSASWLPHFLFTCCPWSVKHTPSLQPRCWNVDKEDFPPPTQTLSNSVSPSLPPSLFSPLSEISSCCKAAFHWHLIRDFSSCRSPGKEHALSWFLSVARSLLNALRSNSPSLVFLLSSVSNSTVCVLYTQGIANREWREVSTGLGWWWWGGGGSFVTSECFQAV